MYDQDIYFEILKYLELNGLEYDDSKVRIVQDANSVIAIDVWKYDIKKPEPEDLRCTNQEINEMRDSYKDEMEVSRIGVVKNINKIKKPKKGMFVFCSDDNTLKVYAKDSWKSFNSI